MAGRSATPTVLAGTAARAAAIEARDYATKARAVSAEVEARAAAAEAEAVAAAARHEHEEVRQHVRCGQR